MIKHLECAVAAAIIFPTVNRQPGNVKAMELINQYISLFPFHILVTYLNSAHYIHRDITTERLESYTDIACTARVMINIMQHYQIIVHS